MGRLCRKRLAEETLQRLLSGEHHNKIQRWLKSLGVETSTAALDAMDKVEVPRWRNWRAEQIAIALELPADMEGGTAQALRRTFYALSMEARDIDDVLKLRTLYERMRIDDERTGILKDRLKVAEETLGFRVYQSQEKAAAEVDAIFADADRMRAMEAERKEGMSPAERIEAIRLRLYGEQAAAKPNVEAKAA